MSNAPEEHRHKKIVRSLGCLSVVAALIAIAVLSDMHDRCLGPFLETSKNIRCIEKRFVPVMPGFVEMFRLPVGPEGPYLKGRSVLVDAGEAVTDGSASFGSESLTFSPNHVSSVLYELPRDLVAWKPEQVGTVVLLGWKREHYGVFSSGDIAYRILCEVTVVDVGAEMVVGRTTFAGDEPQSSKLQGVEGDLGGRAPVHEIVAWLKGLPRR